MEMLLSQLKKEDHHLAASAIIRTIINFINRLLGQLPEKPESTMKSNSFLGKIASGTALALTAFVMQTASAATTNVGVGGATLTFNPPVITINVGDTIIWNNQGCLHTVTRPAA